MATSATGTTTLGQLKIPQPEKFQGQTKEWEEWRVLFKSFLATVNTRYKTLMDWAESMTELIVDADVKEYEELLPEGTMSDPQLTAVQLSRNLHQMLIGFTASPGPRVLVLQNDTANGFETWRRLHLRYSLPIPAKSAGALSLHYFGSSSMKRTLKLVLMHGNMRFQNMNEMLELLFQMKSRLEFYLVQLQVTCKHIYV